MQLGDAYYATTVSATWIKCGIAKYTGTERSIGFLIAEAMRRGIWIERDDYVPKRGDAVCYFWKDDGKGDCTGWPDHIGIVTLPGAHQFTVTEGNMRGGRVWTRPMAVDGRFIRGFIAPTAAASAAAPSMVSVASVSMLASSSASNRSPVALASAAALAIVKEESIAIELSPVKFSSNQEGGII